MKITGVKPYLVTSRRDTKIPSPWVLLQVYTDEGLVGLGDATNWPGGTIIAQAIVEMTEKRLGMTAVVDADGQVLGIYTDGDLRRTLDASLDPHQTPVSRVMTKGGIRMVTTLSGRPSHASRARVHVNAMPMASTGNSTARMLRNARISRTETIATIAGTVTRKLSSSASAMAAPHRRARIGPSK